MVLLTGCVPKTRAPETGVQKIRVPVFLYPGEIFDGENEFRSGRFVRRTIYYRDGATMIENVLLDSVTNTWKSQEYYPGGKPKRMYVSSQEEYPIERRWYGNGQLELEFSRSDGKKDIGVRYYPNGAKKEEFEFVNEQRHGVWAEWDSLGNQTRNEFYVNGKLKIQ